MKKSNLIRSTLALVFSFGLTACGSGGGGGIGGGGGGSTPEIPIVAPVQGMTFDAAERVDIRHNEAKSFDFTNDYKNSANQIDRGTGGQITFVAGQEMTNGDPDSNTAVTIEFENDRAQSGTEYHRAAFIEGNNESNTQKFLVNSEDINGEAGLYAREASLNINGTLEHNTAFVYIPTDDGDTSVGMAGIVGDDGVSNFVGIFGKRTTTNQVSQQRGTATYKGKTHAVVQYAGGPGGYSNGEYRGETQATVDFDAATAPTYSTTGSMKGLRDGVTDVDYAFSGTVNADGSLNTTSVTIQGQTSNDHKVSGSLYGSDAGSLGYVYSATGAQQPDQSYGIHISGGAVLNKD